MNEVSGNRVLRWASVLLYLIVLPHAIVVYSAIERCFPAGTAAKIPSVIIVLSGVIYIWYNRQYLVSLRAAFLVSLSLLIVFAIIYLEPNPNKHIHIPQYILMTWLLYRAISLDYRGGGQPALAFVCSSILGVVDEIQQGLYPSRFYGWSDMIVNSASSLVAAMLIALKKDDRWKMDRRSIMEMIRRNRTAVALLFAGIIPGVAACVRLFDVSEHRSFSGAFPPALFILCVVFLILFTAVIIHRVKKIIKHPIEREESVNRTEMPVDIWILLLLIHIAIVYALVVFAGLSGIEFE